MANLDELIDTIERLPPDELVELVTRLGKSPRVSTAITERIESTPDVCGGSARIVKTRIPVWTLESMKRLGLSDERILKGYPSLSPLDLVAAWRYVNEHAEEIDGDIARNEGD